MSDFYDELDKKIEAAYDKTLARRLRVETDARAVRERARAAAEHRRRRGGNGCPKCGGTGYIREYAHISGGLCFHCKGR